MDTFVVEAVPPRALCALSVALEILLAVVAQHVMLAWYEVGLLRRSSPQYLVERGKFTGLGELAEIAGVNEKVRFVRHCVDLVNCRLQSGSDILVCRLAKTNMAVTNLYKGEVSTLADMFAGALGECPRHWNAATQGPHQTGPRPCHALQKSSAVDTVVVEFLQPLIDEISLFLCHCASLFVSSGVLTGKAAFYSS